MVSHKCRMSDAKVQLEGMISAVISKSFVLENIIKISKVNVKKECFRLRHIT